MPIPNPTSICAWSVPEPTDALLRGIRRVAWELGFEHERVLTTVVITQGDFENGPMSASSLVANILREGVPA